jgi:hypothetical protein
MAAFTPKFRPKPSKWCWCGSGLKLKNCHGVKSPKSESKEQHEAVSMPATQQPPKPPDLKAWGVPGEEHKIWVVPLKKGEQPPKDLSGKPGIFKVQLLLTRPGFAFKAEREHKFIDDLIGSSHLLIAKPKKDRSPTDVDQVLLEAHSRGQKITFFGLPNEEGYLGKLVASEVSATAMLDAERIAYEAVAPFLSAWALHLDIPMNVETIQVTDLKTQINCLRVRTPHFQMTFDGGMSPLISEDFAQYASLYREGMNSSSASYRFLCFFKIIESVTLRRNRAAEAARVSGAAIQKHTDRVPSSLPEFKQMLGVVYPWRTDWDEMAIGQIFPDEIRGKKINWVRDQRLEPLRIGIAHALLKTGEVKVSMDKLEHLHEINKWLPVCRLIARLMMKEEFPTEFEMKMTD